MPRDTNPATLGFLITDTARLLRAEFDRRITDANLGLTAGEARTLVHAARAGAVRQAALAERMGVEAMTLSSYLDRLEAHGLIERGSDPTDRRAKLVLVTDAAEEPLRKIEQVGETVRREAADGIDEADWTRFLSTLKQLRTNLCARRHETGRARPAA